MGLMIWSPLEGGLLTGKYKRNGEAPQGARLTSFEFPPVNKEKAFNIIDAVEPMAKKKQSSVAQLALAWLLHQRVVTSVIIGIKNAIQLEDNLKSTEITFSLDELNKLDEVSKLSPEYPGWMLERQGSDRKK